MDDAFPVLWEQPGDAERTWVWDASSCPLPFSPLSVDHAEALFAGIDRERGLRPHEEGRRVYPHGFFFEWRRPKPGADAPSADEVIEQRMRTREAIAARLRDAWQRDFEPTIRGLCHGIRDRNYDAMSASEIAAVLPVLFAESGSAFGLTMVAAGGMLAAMLPLADFCKAVFGPSRGEALAGELVSGFASYTTDSEVHGWRLARLAEQVPAVRDAILSGPAASAPAALRAVDGSARFLAQLDAYLDLYGWRPEMWVELTLPLWAEDPTPLLRLIARYLEDPRADPRRARRRAAARRRRLLRWARAQLAGAPEQRQQFEQLYARARAYVPVRENRALWQLTATGVLRRPCLALGGKLCAAGLLDTPDDVCYLRLGELRSVAESAEVGAQVALDHRGLIRQRRADRARWLGIVPPLVIGTPDPDAVDDLEAHQGRFASLGLDVGPQRMIQGRGASRGVVRGRARVVRSMAEADTLARGEVLVCRTTSPAWTPLVARAAAVVADAGGVLAHCAIIAREHAIPCVVGTGVATERIADGMLVTVDGTRGLVHLEPADTLVPETHAPEAQSSLSPARAVGVANKGLPATASTEICDAPIVWLGDPACHDATVVGGKAANLSRLAARHRVPPGFCLTATAYQSPAADGALPPWLRAEVHAAYAALGEHCGLTAPAVAVRSSALDEDGGAASFAGQHETILNVVGAEALEEAIVRCWRSLHDHRALDYRAQHGLSVEGAWLAVLVQQLVPAEAAGVIFSANPVTNRRDEAIVTTSYGLGESIVGGTVSPDTYTVSKDRESSGPRIANRQLGEKAVMTVLVDGGTTEAPVSPRLRTMPAVQDADILDAVLLAITLEQEMGWPVDVECAWKDGRLYLLQCRPITTLT